ncbi:MAG TPA: phosphate ABC transporter substrate-binding/OmpA family protein [Gemmatimonadales bacterium]
MTGGGDAPRFTFFGKLVSFLLVAGLIGYGVYLARQRGWWPGSASGGESGGSGDGGGGTAEVVDVQLEVPRLAPAAPYQMKGDTVVVEISEYAGYAGLIAANGGLAPNPNSVFAREGKFLLKLTMSEEESWSALNAGQMAASVTTVDVLAVYGPQFKVRVPAQIGYSRGADGLVVTSDIRSVNGLKGKIVATAQFTEVDFFIRYLAQEAGLGVRALSSLDDAPDPARINLVYTDDGFSAGELFRRDLASDRPRLSGCITWEPKLSEIVEQSGGRARILITNRNLLIVGDILIVNEGFAQQRPQIVAALVKGLLTGNRMVRENPGQYADVIARAFQWTPQETLAELAKVHLANFPENQAFFSGAIDAGGSFAGIYQSAVLAYGSTLIPNPVDAEQFMDGKPLDALRQAGAFADERLAIGPIRTAGGIVETNPLLSRDIRFFFEPNSAVLDQTHPDNLANLDAIRRLLQVSPGSTILLRGHVDNALVAEFRRQGGEDFVRRMALQAMELSRNRAAAVRRLLVERTKVDVARINVVGRGWEEPAGSDSDLNRRVEVQWFTVE